MSVVQAGLEGLRQAETRLEKASLRLAQLPFSITGEPQDVVDISAEAVALLTAKNQFQASLKLMESGADLERATLDILG